MRYESNSLFAEAYRDAAKRGYAVSHVAAWYANRDPNELSPIVPKEVWAAS